MRCLLSVLVGLVVGGVAGGLVSLVPIAGTALVISYLCFREFERRPAGARLARGEAAWLLLGLIAGSASILALLRRSSELF